MGRPRVVRSAEERAAFEERKRSRDRERARARRSDPEVRRAEARRRRERANPDARDADVAAKRRRRADPKVRAAEARAKASCRQGNPEVRHRENESRVRPPSPTREVRDPRRLVDPVAVQVCGTCKDFSQDSRDRTSLPPPYTPSPMTSMAVAAGAEDRRCEELRSSQGTQASTPTAHTGTQCSLELSTSVGCQTEEDHSSDAEVHFVQHGFAGCSRLSSLLGGGERAAEATQQLQGRHGHVHGSSDTGNTARSRQHSQSGDFCIGPTSCEQSRTIVVTFPHPVQSTVPQVTCSICKQTFCDRGSLYAHLKQHGDEKPFLCRFCPKSFSRREQLYTHERLHTGGRPFVCDVCNKAFTKKSCLVVHERLHTGDKPYACKFCPESFARRDRFLIHERLHTGEQPYVCGVCKKSFAEKRNLVFHERSHSCERPFVCDVCTKSFAMKRSLDSHMLSHTRSGANRRSFVCSPCQLTFNSNDALLRHFKLIPHVLQLNVGIMNLS